MFPQNLAEGVFRAAWQAMQRWLHASLSQFHSCNIPTFAKLVWQHSSSKAHAFPVFALSKGFQDEHGLQAGPGVVRAVTLVGTTIQKCEDINFSKLAIK